MEGDPRVASDLAQCCRPKEVQTANIIAIIDRGGSSSLRPRLVRFSRSLLLVRGPFAWIM